VTPLSSTSASLVRAIFQVNGLFAMVKSSHKSRPMMRRGKGSQRAQAVKAKASSICRKTGQKRDIWDIKPLRNPSNPLQRETTKGRKWVTTNQMGSALGND